MSNDTTAPNQSAPLDGGDRLRPDQIVNALASAHGGPVPIQTFPKIKPWNERAYEALGDHWRGYRPDSYMEAEIADLRAALARAPMPDQEPIATADPMPGASGFTMACFNTNEVPVGTKLYLAAPAQADDARDAARLDDTQIDAIARKYVGMGGVEDYRSFARDIASIAASLAGKDKK